MLSTRLAMLPALALGAFAVAPASAQHNGALTMCGKRTDIVESLAKDFKEAQMAVGQVDQSAVLEVFVSDTGTWTILATRTDGSSCIVSSGEGWQSQTLVVGQDA